MKKINTSILLTMILFEVALGISSIKGIKAGILIDENFKINDVSLGEDFSLVSTTDSNGDHLYSFGNNRQGQLGLEEIESSNVPLEVNLENNGIKQISAGWSHAAAITIDSNNVEHLNVWGSNSYGQLGLGEETGLFNNNPEELIVSEDYLDFKIKQVDFGSYHSSAVLTDGENKDHLYTWGDNTYGQLGLGEGTGEFLSVPQEVDIDQDGVFGNEGSIKEVSLGENFSAMIVTDKQNRDHLYTWGYNYAGQLGVGEGTELMYNTPQEVLVKENTIKQIATGSYHAGMITIDPDNQEHLYMWGSNIWGELGVGDTSMNRYLNASFVPLEIPLPQEGMIKEISLGQHFSSMILTDEQNIDHLYTWGDNYSGQLGLGNYVQVAYIPTEVDINDDGIFGDEGTMEQVNLGRGHASVVTNDGNGDHLYMWGASFFGELGLGDLQGEGVNKPEEVFLPVNV